MKPKELIDHLIYGNITKYHESLLGTEYELDFETYQNLDQEQCTRRNAAAAVKQWLMDNGLWKE